MRLVSDYSLVELDTVLWESYFNYLDTISTLPRGYKQWHVLAFDCYIYRFLYHMTQICTTRDLAPTVFLWRSSSVHEGKIIQKLMFFSVHEGKKAKIDILISRVSL